MIDDLITVAKVIHSTYYPDAEFIFLAGSIIRGEGTATSDLDIVVLYKKLPSAYQEAFQFENWPVEAFVHDPETLKYFCFEVDRRSGVPSLPAMISEGLVIPEPCNLSDSLKQFADSVLAEGPPPWKKEDIDKSRYAITILVNDIRHPRSGSELIAAATALYRPLADHYFRTRNLWSAKGKAIPRRLHEVNPRFAVKFNNSFEELFKRGNTENLIALAEGVLEPDGGWFFEGFKILAPLDWRYGKKRRDNAE